MQASHEHMAIGGWTRSGLAGCCVLAMAGCAETLTQDGLVKDGNVPAFTKRIKVGSPPEAAVVTYFPAVESDGGTCIERGPCATWSSYDPAFEVILRMAPKRFRTVLARDPGYSDKQPLAPVDELRQAILLACPSVSKTELADLDAGLWDESGVYVFHHLACPEVPALEGRA